jgi:hypothetical protein
MEPAPALDSTLETDFQRRLPLALTSRWFGFGVAAISAVAAAFLLHQLMAWPPHEDETLALFVGRESFLDVIHHVTRERGGAPLHFVLAWLVAHAGFGLGGLRLVSAVAAVASLPLVALLGARLVGRRTALVGTALFAGSWLFLFHGIYARMYGVFLLVSLAATLALLRALDRGGVGRWGVWVGAALVTVATHPYGILLLGGHALFVLLARRDRLRPALLAFTAVAIGGTPFWLTDLVLAGRFDVGVGGGGSKLGGPGAVADYLWRAAGDASAGWWPATLVVLIIAAIGVRTMRREARLLVLALVAAPVGAFLLARLGGAAAPESRHLIFVAPLLSLSAGAGLVRLTRRALPVLALVLAALLVAEVAWAWHRTSSLFEWEPDKRQLTRAQAEDWLAVTSRSDDVLFGYEPLYLGAWERDRAFPTTVIPRADSTLALRALRRATPLGRGVWVFDASERNNARARLEIDRRVPIPESAFDAQSFGPFLIVRSREPLGTPRSYLYHAARAMIVGRSLGIGDVDVNMGTIERAARVERGYGASRWLGSSSAR